jgi:hypothetical protein
VPQAHCIPDTTKKGEKPTITYYLTPGRMAIIKRVSVKEDLQKREPSVLSVGMQISTAVMENYTEVP